MMRPPSATWAPVAALVSGIAIIIGITVLFRASPLQEPPKTETPTETRSCKPAGCSSQLCVDANEADGAVTTCEFRAEYACYKSAACERQSDGTCGWTQTLALTACLTNPPAIE